MENAGRGVVDEIENKYGSSKGKSFLIVCGKGNNGGDGFVVARHLYNRGARVKVVLIGKASELKGDAAINFKALWKSILYIKQKKQIDFIEYNGIKTLSISKKVNLIVDAIFGTGFSGKVVGIHKDAINWMNASGMPVVSIDIPSGVNADNGRVENVAVQAELVVTMGLKKNGLLIGKSVNYIDDIKVVDISIPREVTNLLQFETHEVEPSDIQKALPKRLKNVHKYNLGKIFVLAGSVGYTGAAAMASQSAMRMGAGAVVLGTASTVYPILAKKLTEVMVHPLESTDEGTISLDAIKEISKFVRWADHLIIGCGLSLNEETIEVVWKVLSDFDIPLLLDADGLTALSRNKKLLKKRKTKNLILTPHSGEFSRLTNLSTDEIENDKVNIAREFAKENKLVLVLKGAPTITACPDGRVFINSTGNPGMATIGSGDVLAGMICGLWAQGMDDFSAAYSGVYLHGLAGDIAKDKLGTKSLMALDIQKNIPNAIRLI
jgi:NAD(P)H-hydrate epimerase